METPTKPKKQLSDLTFDQIAKVRGDLTMQIAEAEEVVKTLKAKREKLDTEVMRRFIALGGQAQLRLKDGQPLVTDNGQHLVDVTGLKIQDPLGFEDRVSQWPGVVTVGVFAHQKAHVCLLGTASGVQTIRY